MATTLLATESFGSYGSASNFLSRLGPLFWTYENSTIESGVFPNTKGTFGNNGVIIGGTLATPLSEVTVGCRINPYNLGTQGTQIITYDVAAGAYQWAINFNTQNGSLMFYRVNSSTPLVISATGLFNINEILDFEADVVISSTVGSIVARINGVQVLNATGLNTQSTANNTFGIINFGSAAYVYDVYLATGGGMLGVPYSPYSPPIANASVQFTPSTGTNYTCVDSTTFQEVIYNLAASSGLTDLFTVNTITGAAPLGVQFKILAARDNTGAANVIPVYKLGSTVTSGPTFALSLTPMLYTWMALTDPNGNPWTTANYNALEVGYMSG